ncbi:fimbrial protein [Intestinirhabdus alba]|jgi:type 1 fimbria pilin|uniref:Fimbrial protein n=1 Tax=Intestinirhabdus alba TaxID=2899544 RepID=A0A6L6IG01_9ENTR|nr:fimbrial protein [Intestinirhabdus alba]MTH44965.1 fimbrial protein [Intestinirhabdus alba]
MRRLHWLGVLAMTFTLPGMAAEDNVTFGGTLVADPCTIPPGEETIGLEFGSVIDKALYADTRTKGVPFTLHLTECDPSLANTLSVTFSGTPATGLPGLLALDAGSTAKGIAIGLEAMDGTPLALEKAGAATQLVTGEMQLRWRAYVQGEPQALATRGIVPGEFSATATFRLDYE